MESVGSRLLALRKYAGLSQTQLAELAGFNQVEIEYYETNRSTPSIATFLWYAKYFNASMDYIFGLCDDRHGRYNCLAEEGSSQIIGNHPNWREFVEACFEPGSKLNRRLKQMVMDMADQHR